MERMKHMRENRYGYYVEVKEEKEVVRVSAHEPRCVAHFFHPNFKRCEIMDKHLEKLAPKYPTTRFIRVHVENIPWLVEKLFIKILPCVICFVDGIAKDRLVGFEELGNEDNFNTAILELRLSQSGVIKKGNGNTLQPLFKVSSSKQSQRDDDVFDLDD
ncbi:thioredoxin-like protein, partial [Agrocybe pediades]